MAEYTMCSRCEEKPAAFTDNQLWIMKQALRGSGISAWPNDSESWERKEWNELVKMGLLKKAKNYTGDKYGMYIKTEKTKAAIAKAKKVREI